MKSYTVLLLLLITSLACSCNQTYPTFAPIENIRLGMTEEEVDSINVTIL